MNNIFLPLRPLSVLDWHFHRINLRNSRRVRLVATAFLALALGATSLAAQVSLIVTVNTDTTTGTAANCTNQSLPGAVHDASCSLRDAITFANTLPLVTNAAITFAGSLGSVASPGTITLANGVIPVNGNTTIIGLGTTALLIDGNGASSIFLVGASAIMSISNLTLQHAHGIGGNQGGAIGNAGVLALAGITLYGNDGGLFSGGAGIYNDAGTLTMTNSTCLVNSTSYFGGSTGYGGCIFNAGGTVTITGSTFAGNQASFEGSQIYSTGVLTIRNSTFVGGGGYSALYLGAGTIIDSTITLNNSFGTEIGVTAAGPVTVTNSIVAGNGPSTGNCLSCTLLAGNIIDVAPGLSVLGSYGGLTQTVVPLANSSAICGGVATVDSTDQRGFTRPNGLCFDSGAAQTNYAIAFSHQPGNTPVNGSITPSVQVTVLDHGLGIPGSLVNMTLNGSGTLSGTLPIATDATGTASFSDLAINTVAAGDTLTATASSRLSATSSTFNVTGGAPTITFVPNPATQVYGTAIAAGSLNASSGSAPGTISYTTTINGTPNQTVTAGATILPVGNYTITASFTPSNPALYSNSSATASYSVTPVTPTLAFTAIPAHTYGDTPFTVSATSASSGAVTYTVASGPATISGNTVTITGATPGSVTLNASQAAAGNYGAATAQVTFTINKQATTDTAGASQTTIPPAQSVTLTATVAAAVSGSPTGTVTFYDNGVQIGTATALTGGSASYATTLAVGVNVISFSYSGDTNFAASAASSSTPVTVTVANYDFTLTGTGTQSQTVVPGSAVTYTFTITPIYGVYPATVTFAASPAIPNATYTFSPATVAANAGPQTISLTIQTHLQAHAQMPLRPHYAPIALGLLLLPFAALRRTRQGARRFCRGIGMAALLLASLAAIAGITGCGSGDGYFGQPVQGYPITVTATSGSVQHSTIINLQVQ